MVTIILNILGKFTPVLLGMCHLKDLPPRNDKKEQHDSSNSPIKLSENLP